MKLFEISFEVCNKVGGIYTVLKTKAPYIVEHYGRENYIMLGFYNPKKAVVEFSEKTPNTELGKIFDELKGNGIECHYGEWLINHYPQVILLDIKDLWKEKDKIKTLLWRYYNVDSLFSSYEFEEPLLWGFACGMLIERIYKYKIFHGEDKFIAHFHEWLSGAGLLYLKMQNLPIATVFTTHATIMGRTLANMGIDLYSKIYEGVSKGQKFPVEEGKKFGIIDKHTMEIASANNADVFSTVSDVTGKEAEYFLHRKPDIILPNGIDIELDITMDEITVRRRKNRNIMRNFLNAYFLGYYNIDTNRIRSIFISGRYEFRNKGIDLFIKALGNLNQKLKKARQRNELNFDAVIGFLFIPSDVKGENLKVMRNVMVYENIESMVNNEILSIKNKIISNIVSGRINKIQETNSYNTIFSNEFINAIRDMFAHFDELKGQNPPISAFDLRYENDAILSSLKENGLENKEEDVVKVINYPVYLSPRDMLINLDYYAAISTFDIGIFPSYYEPWGYTPLESAKYGVITITTDLAGFGNFIEKKDGGGIYVIQRKGKNDEEVVENLTKKILEILNFSDDERVKARIRARELATFCDWKILVNNYFEAHKMAIEKAMKR